MKTYAFDLDNTICLTSGENYKDAHPLPSRIKKINQLHDDGNTIIIWTARGAVSGINWRKLTEQQLKSWGVKYDKLSFKKEYADEYIDDRATNAMEFFK